ncbi:UNKNOWN [Stylonychia lemnae]|uniref:Uncharacterized protein n=1 Tax=Stylonychia lemnae TaxID=5949 RepID=A0A077ZRW2_STYLE|nr:UNKNOWN [Stylonychia lemnae]|eukprot:CDW72612.1 UNKNOWN [Stylonychia lemnae]
MDALYYSNLLFYTSNQYHYNQPNNLRYFIKGQLIQDLYFQIQSAYQLYPGLLCEEDKFYNGYQCKTYKYLRFRDDLLHDFDLPMTDSLKIKVYQVSTGNNYDISTDIKRNSMIEDGLRIWRKLVLKFQYTNQKYLLQY